MLNPPLRSVLILKVNRGGRNRPPRRDFTCGFPPLLSYAELFDYRAVTLNVNLLKISEKIAAVSDHLEKTAAAVVILLVGLKMLGKGVDPVCKDCDLNLGGSGIALVSLVLLDNSCFFLPW